MKTSELTEAQTKAIQCAFLDLIGARDAMEKNDILAHDWHDHEDTISELLDAFGPILDKLHWEEGQ